MTEFMFGWTNPLRIEQLDKIYKLHKIGFKEQNVLLEWQNFHPLPLKALSHLSKIN